MAATEIICAPDRASGALGVIRLKKLLSMRNVLIAIAFTVFLLYLKDNLGSIWGFFKAVSNVLTPFFIGFLIAYILNFPYKFLCTKVFGRMGQKHKALKRLKKPLALIITYLLTFAIIAALIVVLIPQIINNLTNIVKDFPSYYKTVETEIQNQADRIAEMNLPFIKHFSKEEIFQNLTKFFTGSEGATKAILNWLQTFMASFAKGAYNFLMGVIISVYFLIYKEQLCRQVKKVAVAFIPIKYLPKLYEIVDITDTKCGRFLVGDIIDSAVVGVLFFMTLSIAQFPYASLIAVICGVTNIIPFFGPFIGAIPSGFILLMVDPWLAFWFVIIVIVIQQIDGNVLKPNIIGNQVGVSGFWVLFSVIVGGAMFGVIGFVLGTPIFAVIYSLVAKKARNKVEEKGKIAREALDFKVLNYAEIAEEQRKIRAEKEQEQRKKLQKLLHLGKEEHDEDDDGEDNDGDADNDNAEEKFADKVHENKS